MIDERKGEQITQRQIADLEVIALKCPMQVGHVIYSARRIVSERTNLRYDQISDCGRVDSRNRQSILSSKGTELKIVPNPASDQITLHLPNADRGNVAIMTLSGVEVYSLDVNKINQIDIQTSSLKNGVYIVSYISEVGVIHTTKLVIVD